ncbi:multiheme c-type cytochrome [Dankookia sp. P2]|uniref:multiheme c-type cytochrome n=1 Tax=Dankookia sp. P2 TaxID=3423955 RepID=UPI003D666C57
MMRLASAAIAVLLAGGSLVVGAVLEGEAVLPRPMLEAPREGHVGALTCAGCHQAEYQDWRGSHHQRAMEAASGATVQAPFAGETMTYFGRESRFFRRDGRFLALTEGTNGQPAEFEVTHTIGVAPLQQYLVPLPGGRLQPLPWAWDARPAGRAASAGFISTRTRTSRPATRCTGPAASRPGTCNAQPATPPRCTRAMIRRPTPMPPRLRR